MKSILKISACIFLSGMLNFISCKKEAVQAITPSPSGNKPPVANAGPDQTITSTLQNNVNLDGSASTDPDKNITNYLWTNISGPSGFTIANANAAQTQVNNLIQGVYLFELKVTDAGALFSKDTMQVTVNAAVVAVDCNGNIRPQVNAQLIPIGTLSQSLEL